MFFEVLKKVFGEYFDTLFSLICYKITKNSAMNYAKIWFNGNIASKIFKKAKIKSQQISSFLNIFKDIAVSKSLLFS